MSSIEIDAARQINLSYDVIRLICVELGESSGWSLAQLARTCQAFHEPALDILWSKQASLIPALKTLGPKIWERTFTRFGLECLVCGTRSCVYLY